MWSSDEVAGDKMINITSRPLFKNFLLPRASGVLEQAWVQTSCVCVKAGNCLATHPARETDPMQLIGL